jgi:glycosyltransferase involved in cell wall biosynthesis
MKKLLEDPNKAMALSRGARETALEKFHIERFIDDWSETFTQVVKASKALIV